MDYRNLLEAATGRQKAELVLKNALLLDVYNADFFKGDLAIEKGFIAGIGEYDGVQELDCTGRYIVPTFIDGHMHIESSMVTPAQYSRAVIPHGVTTVLADPHEIANVLGKDGIIWLMEAAKGLLVDFRFMIPSCVPSAPNEHSGHDLPVADMAALRELSQTQGLGEMMDFPTLLAGSETIAQKLLAFAGMPQDGHGPGITGKALNAYVAAGIMTEHECSTPEEMAERIRLGMYIQIREGTPAKNAPALLPQVNDKNWHRCFFCTDDKDPLDILKEGTIDHIIRLAIAGGMDPARAYTMASFNPAAAYGLSDRGALSPGKLANFVVLDHLTDVSIQMVFAKGQPIYKVGEPLTFAVPDFPRPPSPIKIHKIYKADLTLEGTHYNALQMNPGSLLTPLVQGTIEDAGFPYSQGLCKLVNVERHRGLPLLGVCAMTGFGIKHGAIATTIVHDAHNLLCAGDNDEDILLAIHRAAEIGGGIVMVCGGKILHELHLPIAGLITDDPVEEVAEKLGAMNKTAHTTFEIPQDVDPFLALSFMALPVIPDVKLTVEGLFHVTDQKLIPPVY